MDDESRGAETSSSSTEEKMEKKNDKFPMGMRVLAVDDDKVCLKVLEKLLLKCGYEVTATENPHTALQLLRENSDNYDLVISDVKMPDMDGFKLLEIVGLEMDLPVIMMSVDSEVSTVMKGVRHGACDYLVKPVRIEELKIIWKHVLRKSSGYSKKDNGAINRPNEVVKSEEDHNSNFIGNCKEPKRERNNSNDESDEEPSRQKRHRVAWSRELHDKFINALNLLGVTHAVPKKILDLMDVPGLTRENVASHLQKYRKALKKNSNEACGPYPGASNLSGFSVDTPNSGVFSFMNRVSNVSPSESFRAERYPNVSPSESFRVERYPNYQSTIQFNHAQHSRNGHTHITNPWSLPPLDRQNNLWQQQLPASQASQLRTPRFGAPSDPWTMKAVTQFVPGHLNYQAANPSTFSHPRFMPQETIDARLDSTNTPQVGRKDRNFVVQTEHLEHRNDVGSGADFEMAQVNGSTAIDEQKQLELIIYSPDPSPFLFSNNDPADGDLLNVVRQVSFKRNPFGPSLIFPPISLSSRNLGYALTQQLS